VPGRLQHSRLRPGGLPLVRAASQADPIGKIRTARLRPSGAAILLGVAVLLVVCGCGGSSGQQSASGAGPRIAAPLRLADCTDWERSDAAERLGTIRQLRDFAGGPTGSPAERGSVLDDDDAYRLLQGTCGNYYARGFKLYKVYTRAASFVGH
jgi:hypothetical protein